MAESRGPRSILKRDGGGRSRTDGGQKPQVSTRVAVGTVLAETTLRLSLFVMIASCRMLWLAVVSQARFSTVCMRFYNYTLGESVPSTRGPAIGPLLIRLQACPTGLERSQSFEEPLIV